MIYSTNHRFYAATYSENITLAGGPFSHPLNCDN